MEIASATRRLNLGDVMILIFTLAIGLAISIRPMSDIGAWLSMIKPAYRYDLSLWWYMVSRKNGPQFLVIQGCVLMMSCFVAPLTPTLMLVRLRRPRPNLRELLCQPGFAAATALCAVAIASINLSVIEAVSPRLGMILPGASVLTTWLVLLALRRWHPEASWIDRSGRAVGAFWLATIPWVIWAAS